MNPPHESLARIAELLALYRLTRYGVALPSGESATLRIGERPPEDVANWIGASGTAIYLTACNPYSHPLPPIRNAERMDTLRRRLRELGARWLEGSGGIAGGTWSEPSLLVVGAELYHLDRLAREFGQNASVRVSASAPAVLRLHRKEWRVDVPAEADLEWDDA